MVTGIFDVDGGNPFWEAVHRYRDAGYAIGWAVHMARRHGDPTSRRRVFLVAVFPECTVDGKDASGFFSVEGTSIEVLGGSTSPSGFLKRGPTEARRYGGRS